MENNQPDGGVFKLKYIVLAILVCLFLVVMGLSVFLVFFLSNATPSTPACASQLMDGPGGACCAAVCSAPCANGFKPGTCHCECLPAPHNVSTAPVVVSATPSSPVDLTPVFGEPPAAGEIAAPPPIPAAPTELQLPTSLPI